MSLTILLANIVLLFAGGFVTVGNEHNSPNSQGTGRVDYPYEIQSFEVDNAAYCFFLNSVARDSDPYQLYSSIMGQHFAGGIVRTTDANGKCKYTVRSGFEQMPVIGVTWNSCIRFVNWLHYNSAAIEKGSKSLADYVAATEGDAQHGAYDTRNINTIVKRNPDAVYWLPNQDEWLKACYFDGKSWNENILYQGANCYSTSNGWMYPYPHIKKGGAPTKPSHYGTYDQQGNLAEWVENKKNDFRLAYGGSFIRPSQFAKFNENEGDFPNKSIPSFGLRVCRTTDKAKRLASYVVPTQTTHKVSSHATATLTKKGPNGGTYVKVGDAGNPGDAVNQYKGRVNYEYYISKYELSNQEYCNFLNSVATKSDPYNLYDVNMSNGVCGGIVRTGAKGNFHYSIKSGWGGKPVVYIGFYELARYANWLHYGCPKGNEEMGVTEGDDQNGAYDTRDFEAVRKGEKAPYKDFGTRNKGAKFWIPNGNEWYKAAYYDPNKLGNRKYYDYPTHTSDAPTADEANYMIDNAYSSKDSTFVADVTAYPLAASYYGTQQQGGNVWEWTESWQYGIIGNRALRGGSWQYTEFGLNALNEDPGGINDKSYLFGGRLCMAATDDGFVPVGESLQDKTTQWILLLSKNRLLLLFSTLGLFSLMGFIWLAKMFLRFSRKIYSKINN